MSLEKPLLLEIPETLQTERLLLRMPRAGDGKDIFEGINETRALLREWFSWCDETKAQEDAETTARKFQAKFILRQGFPYLIYSQDRFIGCVSLNNPYWQVPSASIGYWCRLSEQGKGYMREATAALTLIAFQKIDFKRVTVLVDDENTKSWSIPESLGFTLERRALGLHHKPGCEDLRRGRTYVRFDTKGLERWKVSW